MPQFLVVGAGAALGAVARYLLSAALGGGMLPLLVINILGSALMGYFRPGPFWGTGVLGGFTSFATFAFLTSEAHWTVALAYVLATIIGCVYRSGGERGQPSWVRLGGHHRGRRPPSRRQPTLRRDPVGQAGPATGTAHRREALRDVPTPLAAVRLSWLLRFTPF